MLQPDRQSTGAMVLPTPASSPMLDERQRAALSDCLTSVLGDLVAGVTSATVVSAALDAVLSAANNTCAGFATQWNDRNARTFTKRLPVEVITACLGYTDFKTRVRASHVSRSWRSALVSDPRLWNDIYCPLTERTEWAFGLLDTLLQRSSPLPIRLRFPHTCYADDSGCRTRVTALVAPHIHRLQSYAGPYNVFLDLDPSRRPLPALTSLDFSNSDDDDCDDGDYIVQRPEWGAQRLPNLRRLVAPMLKMTERRPYERLQHLVCDVSPDDDDSGPDLFRCFPNLVTAEFVGVVGAMLLPRGPLPRSIECVTIRSEGLPGELSHGTHEDFACLHHWAAERIPRLVLHGAGFVSDIARAFVSTHGSALRLDVAGVLTIASAPDARCVWEVHTLDGLWTRHDCGAEMRAMLVYTAASTISVTNERICAFFSARARLPHLVSLRFDLRYLPAGDTVLPADAHGTHYVDAPNLQHVCLEVRRYEWTLGVLLRNFRRMIVYDADLLETLTVDYLGYAVTQLSDCGELARFAKQYIEMR